MAAMPTYFTEVAPPKSRGLITGAHAIFINLGFCIAGWIGYVVSLRAEYLEYNANAELWLQLRMLLHSWTFFCLAPPFCDHYSLGTMPFGWFILWYVQFYECLIQSHASLILIHV